MNLFELKNKLKSSAAIRLLRIDHSPLVISFLYKRFKVTDKMAVSFTELTESLTDFLEEARESGIGDYPQTAVIYLKQWIEHGFLRNSYEEDKEEFITELTPDTEKVFRWLDDLSAKEFVGTESRFLLILNLLREIAYESMEDPREKLKELKRQKSKIEKEIKRIKKEGVADTSSPTRIKEQYFLAKETAKDLIADFRQVEHNFRDIAGDIQKKHLVENLNKGEIVDYLLTSDDDLKDSDQGRSFFAFWNFLRSPAQQLELQKVLNRIYKIADIEALENDDRFLKRIRKYLFVSGENVQKSTRKMSEQIRRVLDQQNLSENRRVIDLTNRIKKWVIEHMDEYPTDRALTSIEGDADIHFMMDRPFWNPNTQTVFDPEKLEAGDVDMGEEEFMSLLSSCHVDIEVLKNNIQKLLRYKKKVPLKEVLEHFPAKRGLEEIICYVQLADENKKHSVNADIQEMVQYTKESDGRVREVHVKIPQVIYQV